MRKKKVILIDLDGVLNNYTGNFREDYIPDIKDGAKDFLINLSNNFLIKIFTTRNKNLTLKWLIKNDIIKYIDDITNTKEPAWLYVDDRCIRFDGNFDSLNSQIKNFRTWYK